MRICFLPLLLVLFASFASRAADLRPNAPRLRGVMVAPVPREADFRDLREMGASLIRYQLCAEGSLPTNATRKAAMDHFDTWLGKRLDILETQILPWARKYKLQVVVDLHDGPGGRMPDGETRLFHDPVLAAHLVRTWGRIAARFKGNADILYGYDLLNEPIQRKPAAANCDWQTVQRRCSDTVRAVDQATTLIWEVADGDLPGGFEALKPSGDTNTVYEVHVYQPHAFTHQFVLAGLTNAVDYPVTDANGKVTFDKENLHRLLNPVMAFSKQARSRIYVGEFSAISWAPGESAARYLADCIALFEEYGWDWTYHAFREWQGWSVEHAPAAAPGVHKFIRSDDNPRKRVLLAGFKGQSFPLVRAPVADTRLREASDKGWRRAMGFWYEKTALVYDCPAERVQSSANSTNNLFHWHPGLLSGYGAGMSDCALICGTALSGLADKWLVTRDPSAREDAAKVAKGVLNLAKAHGYKGFVARGICADDGKTACSLSSRDQYTHWVHGLWRYVTSGMAEPELVKEYQRLVEEVASFMERRIVPETNWNFGLADGSKDPRGICTMWGPDVWPHEAARLPMIYCAAYLATRHPHWKEMYERYIDEAIERTLQIHKLSPQEIGGRMPCYSLFQANTSLELILAWEKDPSRVAKIQEAMSAFAKLVHERESSALRYPRVKHYGMCWEGELLLTQLMTPDWPFTADERQFLENSLLRDRPEIVGVCRIAHLMTAYWRYRRLQRMQGEVKKREG